MNSTASRTPQGTSTHANVASYRTHTDAEAAVRLLASGGLPIESISIIGKDYETKEDVLGYYRPADAALSGAGQGAWFGGLFGLMLGAFGFFVFPVVGSLLVMGPLAGMIAGAIGGAGIGALINALVAAGIPKDQALKYQSRLQAGEYLIVVHGGSDESTLAHKILEGTPQQHLEAYKS